MSNIYMQNILDHFHNPENYGELKNANRHTLEHNPVCGDKIELFMVVDADKIVNLKFKGEGCAISQAAMSILSDEIIGLSVEDARKYSKDTLIELLGIDLSPTRLKCALLSLQAVHRALNKN